MYHSNITNKNIHQLLWRSFASRLFCVYIAVVIQSIADISANSKSGIDKINILALADELEL